MPSVGHPHMQGKKLLQLAEDADPVLGQRVIANLSLGNPLIIPEVARIWEEMLSSVLSCEDVASSLISRYGHPNGETTFVDAILDYINPKLRLSLTRKNILVTPGSQAATYYALETFCGTTEDGQTLPAYLPQNPEYVGYRWMLKRSEYIRSATPTIVEGTNYRFRYVIDLDKLGDASGMPLGCILLSRPCNPTGHSMTDLEIQQLRAIALRRGVPLIIDAAYGLPFPGIVTSELNPIIADDLITLMSFSKCGLAGERLGIAIGPKQWIDILSSKQSGVCIQAPRLVQQAAANAIQTGMLEKIVSTHIRPLYAEKRQRAEQLIRTYVTPDVDWRIHESLGTFYLWLWLKNSTKNCWELCEALRARGILMAPGQPFFIGVDDSWSHQFECVRISLTASNDELEQGISALASELQT